MLLAVPVVLVPASAESISIGADDTTVTADGVTYNVLRTAEDFKAITGNNNYIFANDIDLAGAVIDGSNASLIKGWSGVLEGNGHSLTGYSIINANGTGLINCLNGEVVTIRNLTVGSEAAPISALSTGNGATGIVIGGVNNNGGVTFENCTVWGNMDESVADGALYSKAQKGLFVGKVDKASPDSVLTFVNCTANGVVKGNNKIGGFLACNYSAATLIFTNCTNNAAVSGRQFVGGFVGIVQAKGPSSFESCVNNGAVDGITLDAGDTDPTGDATGGFIGKNTGDSTIKLCTNNGTVVGNATKTGTLVGLQSEGAQLTVIIPAGTTINADYCGKVDEDTPAPIVYDYTVTPIETVDDLKAIKASGSYTLVADDLVLTEKLTLNVEGLDVTLALNGMTLTGQLEFTGAGSVSLSGGTLANEAAGATLTVAAGTTVTMSNVNVTAADLAVSVAGSLTWAKGSITSSGDGIAFTGAAVATLSELNASAEGSALVGDGEGTAEMAVTVSSGVYASKTGDAAVWESLGKLTVVAGEFTGAAEAAGLRQTTGEVTVNGGTFGGQDALAFSAADAAILATVNGGTFKGTRAAVAVAGNNDSYTVTITDGSFDSDGDIFFNDSSNAAVAATGGEFSKEFAEEFVGQYYVLTQNAESGLYEVVYHTCDYTDMPWEYMNTGSHKQACKICGETKTEAHDWSDEVDNGDGTHSRVCSVCNGKSSPMEHEMEYVDNGDGTHSATCPDCGLVDSGEYVFDTATSLGDGRHEKICSVCGASVIEACVEQDGKCATCGAEIDGGCGSSISVGLLALIPMISAPLFFIKKKKEQ